jgi:hypothetical protein
MATDFRYGLFKLAFLHNLMVSIVKQVDVPYASRQSIRTKRRNRRRKPRGSADSPELHHLRRQQMILRRRRRQSMDLRVDVVTSVAMQPSQSMAKEAITMSNDQSVCKTWAVVNVAEILRESGWM